MEENFDKLLFVLDESFDQNWISSGIDWILYFLWGMEEDILRATIRSWDPEFHIFRFSLFMEELCSLIEKFKVRSWGRHRLRTNVRPWAFIKLNKCNTSASRACAASPKLAGMNGGGVISLYELSLRPSKADFTSLPRAVETRLGTEIVSIMMIFD